MAGITPKKFKAYSSLVERSGPGASLARPGRAKAASKMKANFGFTSEERKAESVSINVTIKKKLLDGKELVTYTASHYNYETGKNEEKEYTDLESFLKDCLAVKLPEAAKAVS